MKSKTPVCDFLKQYQDRQAVRLHMPGHKGVERIGCEAWDITEVEGADALYEAEGILAESEQNASDLFGFGRTYYSTEGSTQCLKAMLYLAKKFAPPAKKNVILAGRNAHKAFLYGCALLDLEVRWLFSETQNDSVCSCHISAGQVEQALAGMEEKPAAVYLTAPDYLGYSPDLSAISAVCQRAQVPLLVDNAHGAYLKFLPYAAHPLELGASMSCDSAHKTLPVLTGGAYLHLSETWANKVDDEAKKALELFGSTSPSYLILASLDACNAYLATSFSEHLRQSIQLLEQTKEHLRTNGWHVEQTDPLKLTLCTAAYGYTGKEVSAYLQENGIVCEFADSEYLVCMVSVCNTAAQLKTLEELLSALPQKEKILLQKWESAAVPQRMSIREAIFAPSKVVPVKESVGKICAAPEVACPPAVPIVASGEEITEEMLAIFDAYGIMQVRVVEKNGNTLYENRQ